MRSCLAQKGSFFVGIHMTRFLLPLILLLRCFFTPGACPACEQSLLNPGLLCKRELALIHILDHDVPVDAKRCLNWMSKSDILHTLRNTIRYTKYADLFCGTGGMSAAFTRHHLTPGVALDISLGGALHDILSPAAWHSTL